MNKLSRLALERLLEDAQSNLDAQTKITLGQIKTFASPPPPMRMPNWWFRSGETLAEILPRVQGMRSAQLAHKVMALRQALHSGGRR